MSTESLIVPRAAFDIEEPWNVPPECKPVHLRRATDAASPRLGTSVAVWYDDEFVTVLFSAADDHVDATHLQHDAPLYEHDVVEVFIAPERVTDYFEFEISPRGTMFDARVHSPDGVRATMQVDRDWNCEGLFAVIRKTTEQDISLPTKSAAMTIDTLIRIPFAALDRSTPAAGEEWRGNFFRIDRHPEHGDELSAWQPTMKTPADFHVTAAFGVLRFE
jgi:Carbohydrate-binding family 9